jgi:hypothetical protein
LIYSFLIRLPSLFLLQLLMKYGSELAERPSFLWTTLYLRAIKDLRKFDDLKTLNIVGGFSLLGWRLLFSAIPNVEHFDICVIVVPISSTPLII